MITLKNFTKKYGDFTAVNDISFTFERGVITGILGPNGAGKTTLLKALCGRHFATEGQILITDFGEYTFEASEDPQRLRRITGFVEEVPSIPQEYTVKEYISSKAMLQGVPLTHVKKTIDLCNLKDVENKKIKALSKGYRERVNFAQALVYEPEILIFDEPASGLDPQQIIKMRSLVKELSVNHTIILSTHLMQEVEALCDKVMIINKGKLLTSGTIDSICRETSSENLEEAFFKLIEKDSSEGNNE